MSLLSQVKCEIVDDCAALEKQNPSASRRGGKAGEASSQNWLMPLFSWHILFLFIETFIYLSMKRKQFLWQEAKNAGKKLYVGLASESKIKLLVQPEQSIKWINSLEPSVIQYVCVKEFKLY